VARQLRGGGERYGIARRARVSCDHAACKHASTVRAVLAGALAAFLLFGAERHGAVAVNDELPRTAFHRFRPPCIPEAASAVFVRTLANFASKFLFQVSGPCPASLRDFATAAQPETAAWSLKIAGRGQDLLTEVEGGDLLRHHARHPVDSLEAAAHEQGGCQPGGGAPALPGTG
jgi:hypothetical protein